MFNLRFQEKVSNNKAVKGTKRNDDTSIRSEFQNFSDEPTDFPRRNRQCKPNVVRDLSTQRDSPMVTLQRSSEAGSPDNATESDISAIHEHSFNKYLEMRKQRAILMRKYIEENKMDDPTKKYRIEDARSLIGECNDMCPEYERYEREYQNGLMEFEKIPGTNRVDHKRAVKRYRRSAAGDETPLPSDIRPLHVLRQTLEYLIREIVCKHGLEKSHSFVRDRTRAIRKDLTIQNISDSGAIGIYEIIARYHLLCSHRLCHVIEVKQEYEQLEKTLQSLMEFYNESLYKGIKSPREAEFRAYYLLHYAYNHEVQANFERIFTNYRPELVTEKRIVAAIRLRGLLPNIESESFVSNGISSQKKKFLEPGTFESFSEIFDIISDPSFSYLMRCAFHPHIRSVRRSALNVMTSAFYILPSRPTESLTSLAWLERVLHYDSSDELIKELENMGIEIQVVNGSVKAYIGKIKGKVPNAAGDFKKYNNNNKSKPTLPALKASKQLIESKAAGASLLDILYEGDTYNDANVSLSEPSDSSINVDKLISAPLMQNISSVVPKDMDVHLLSQKSGVIRKPSPILLTEAETLLPSNSVKTFPSQPKSYTEASLGYYTKHLTSPDLNKKNISFKASHDNFVEKLGSILTPKPLVNAYNEKTEHKYGIKQTKVSEAEKNMILDRKARELSEEYSLDLILDVLYDYAREISAEVINTFLRKKHDRIISNWRRLISYLAVRNALLQRERDNNRCILAISRADAPSFAPRFEISPSTDKPKYKNLAQIPWVSFDSEFTSKKINVAETLAPLIAQQHGEFSSRNDYFSLPSHLKLVIFTPGSSTRAGNIAENWIRSSFMTSSSFYSSSLLQVSSSKIVIGDQLLEIYAVVTHAIISQGPYQTFTMQDEKLFSGVRMVVFEFDIYDESEEKATYFSHEKGRFFKFAHMRHDITGGSGTPIPVLVLFWYVPKLTVEEYRLKIVQEGNLSEIAKKCALKLVWMEIPLHGTVPEIRRYSEALEANIKKMIDFIPPEPKFLFLSDKIPNRQGSLLQVLLSSEFYKFVSEVSRSVSGRSSEVRANIAIFNIITKAFNTILELLSFVLCSQSWRRLNWPPLEFTSNVTNFRKILGCDISDNYRIPADFGWNSRKKLDKILHIILSHKPDLVDISENQMNMGLSPLAIETAGGLNSDYRCIFLKYASWVSHLCRKQLIVPLSSESSIQLKLKSIIQSYSRRRPDIIPFPYYEICTSVFQLIVLQLEYKLVSVGEPIPYPAFAIPIAFRECAFERDRFIKNLSLVTSD